MAGKGLRKRPAKKPSTKTAFDATYDWKDSSWKVVFGELKRGRGRPIKGSSIFTAFGEKLPKESIDHVDETIEDEGISREGVYFAHDSMGCARYAGRGSVFSRLRKHFKAHPKELFYYSFYLIAEKKHERDIETALIRVASHLLVFNTKKKRADIQPGNVSDYEGGTLYFERQKLKGRRAKPAAKKASTKK